MALFDQAFKDEVRGKNDIVEVISSYVKLERRGNRFVGLCPFHGEKTPSFNVLPDKQIYHCFGCKAGGDVFTFVQERDHLTFYEALVFLAKRARIPLPHEERTPEEDAAYRERRALYDALDLAARFFHAQLLSEPGKAGLEYLLQRGITEETIRQFRVGWAPGYGRLYRSLTNRFNPEVLQNAGLIVPRREGPGFMDAFYERVMFPITDLSGRVVGFGGRILQGNGPKYKNTAESPVFSKRNVLFGIGQAREAMRTKNQAILVEGYVDVIMPHQVGIKHVVAPLGTALTDEQCAVLRRQAQQVIVAFDSDTAGQLATLRGLEKLYDIGCDVRILHLPDGKDPDEYIRAHGAPAFQRCIDESVPLIEFKLRLALTRNAGNSAETKAKAVEAVARVLAALESDVLREEYVHKVANELASTPLDVRELKLAIDRQMNRLLRQGFQNNQTDSRNNSRVFGPVSQAPALGGANPAGRLARPAPVDPVRKAEQLLLYLLLQYPTLLSRIETALGENPFEDPIHAAIYRVARPICARAVPGAGPVVTGVLDSLPEVEARQVLTEMVAKPLVTVDSEKEAGHCIEKIKGHRDSRRKDYLENVLKTADEFGQPLDPAVMREYIELQQRQRMKGKGSIS